MQDAVRDMQHAVREARAQFLRRRTELLEDSVLQFCFRTEILTVGKPLRQCRTLTLTSAMLKVRACFHLGRRRRTLVFEEISFFLLKHSEQMHKYILLVFKILVETSL